MATVYDPVDGIEAAKNFAILRREEQEAQTPQQEPNAGGWIAIAVIAWAVLCLAGAIVWLLVSGAPL